MSHLQRILEAKRELLPGKMRQNPLKEMRQRAEDASPTRGFQSALATSAHEPSLIAEVKRASPVKGVVREDFDAANIAAEYRDAGDIRIALVTEEEPFKQLFNPPATGGGSGGRGGGVR
jgi:indole-3-glycerol phosphate synthase